MIWAVIWYWLLGVFTTADIMTTLIAISNGAHEMNPFMAAVLDHIIEVKFCFLILMIGITYWSETRYKGNGWIAPAGPACVTFTAVVYNLLFFL